MTRLLILAAGLLLGASDVFAGEPAYLILAAPQRQVGHQRVYHPGRPLPVTRPTYAYGYFGAARRPQWSVHRGYHGRYWQLSRW